MGPFWRPGAWAPEAAGADIGHPKISENHLENTGIPWIYMDLPSIYGIFTIHLWYFYHPFMVFSCIFMWVCAMEWGLAILEQEPDARGNKAICSTGT